MLFYITQSSRTLSPRLGACVTGCLGAWVPGCLAAWVPGCLGAAYTGMSLHCTGSGLGGVGGPAALTGLVASVSSCWRCAGSRGHRAPPPRSVSPPGQDSSPDQKPTTAMCSGSTTHELDLSCLIFIRALPPLQAQY